MDDYEKKVISIINKIGDLYISLDLAPWLPEDALRQPTLDEVEHLLDVAIEAIEQAKTDAFEGNWS